MASPANKKKHQKATLSVSAMTVNTSTPFPVAKQASRLAKQALSSSNTNPFETISKFQQTHSLHSYLSKAFGTTSIYSLSSDNGGVRGGAGSRRSGGSSGRSKVTRGVIEQRNDREQRGVMVEPFEPESVLTFLNHLGVSRYEIHKKIGDALRDKLESEIQKVDLPSSSSSSKNKSSKLMQSGSGSGEKKLLELLKSSWEYIHVPELRPVFVTLINKLGDRTPVEVLLLLAKKDTTAGNATNANSTDNKQLNEDTNLTNLKYGELLNQFGLPMKRLVWEADWSSVVRGDGQLINTDTNGNAGSTGVGTLHSTNILSDLVRPLVTNYVMDETLRKAADLAYPSSGREKRMDTQRRRKATTSSNNNTNNVNNSSGSSSVLIGTLSNVLGTGNKSKIGENTPTSSNTNTVLPQPDAITNSSGVALAELKAIMGQRPKLLSAILNMLIAEHGETFKQRDGSTLIPSKRISILGGSSHLHCTLVADILLSYGQLPKQYEYVQILAKILDESVRKGLISDQVIAQIQGCLSAIFHSTSSEKDVEKNNSTNAETSTEKKNKNLMPSNDKDAADLQFEYKLLRKIIKRAVARMKENDIQGLFLNPVTDDIAPGYSKVIAKPICLSEIEKKAIDLHYTTMTKFENDVKLMFENCIKYNIGRPGEWFRGEARKQQKKWKDVVLKSCKDLYSTEMSKRKKISKTSSATPPESAEEKIRVQQQNFKKLAESKKVGDKRKFQSIYERNDTTITSLLPENISPLPQSRNKRRKNDIEQPSMPALASMLLSDPLVVRLLLFKVLNAMRNDIMKSKDTPANHKTVPSVMQMLYIVQISAQLCAKRGRIYVIPDVGFTANSTADSEDKDSSISDSYLILRKYAPLVTKLMLDAEIDKRFSIGGDFHNHLLSTRSETKADEWAGSTSSSNLLLCLVQGALVPLLQPGASNEQSLLVQLPRFFTVIKEVSGGNMVNEEPFFVSLSHTILKHKHKLPHSVRDLIVKNWLGWFASSDGSSSMIAAVHLTFIQLLNEWSSFGNQILPRDSLLSFSEDAVRAASCNEKDKSRTFDYFWQNNSLGDIKLEYERMLKSVPEERCSKWKKAVGLEAEEVTQDDIKMEEG